MSISLPSDRLNSKVAIGIDLGTTFSCVAVYQNEKVKILTNPEGYKKTPSEVAFPDFLDKEPLVGNAARNQGALNPKTTIFNVKRLIGRNFDDPELETEIENLPFTVSKEFDLVVEIEVQGERKHFTPEEITATLLQKMKNTAERHLGHEVKDAVITVPACFNNNQRLATKIAAEIAGLNVLRLINEPTAAALAYSFDRGAIEKQRLLLFDFGGGCLDVSIIKISQDALHNVKFEVIATAGDNHLGGSDFDVKIFEHCCKIFKQNNKIDVSKNARSMKRLRIACEAAKKVLSTNSEAAIDVDALHNRIDFCHILTREKFEEISADLFEKALNPVKKVLKDAGIEKSEIDRIVLVGGTSRIPKVHQLLTTFFHKEILGMKNAHAHSFWPVLYVNADEAVAYGAAVQAAILSGMELDLFGQVSLQEIMSRTIYLDDEAGNHLVDVFLNNSKIPLIENIRFQKKEKSQTSLVMIMKEKFGNYKKCRLLSTVAIEDISPSRLQTTSVIATFKVDENGILTVTAVDSQTNERKTVNFGNRRLKSHLQMVKESKSRATEEQAKCQKSEAKKKLEIYVNKVEQWLFNNTVQLSIDNQKELVKQIKNGLDLLSDEKNKEDEFERVHEQIKLICDRIMNKQQKNC